MSGDAVDILGVPVHPVTVEDLVERAVGYATSRRKHTIAYANVHVVNEAQHDAVLRRFLAQADTVYCDGAGVRLGARLLGWGLPRQLTLFDFADRLMAACAARGLRVFWVGGRPGVAQSALASLASRHPGLSIAGARDGYFAKEGAGSEEVVREINGTRPHIVFVGFGTPLQERWLAQVRQRLEAPLVWCVGAAAEFVSGETPRAPVWMRESGLEWLYRLAHEPRRMFGRYVIGNPLFLLRVVRARIRRRAAPR